MSPTGWAITGCGCGAKCWDAVNPAAKDYAEGIATQVMWAATGRRYGLASVTVMPCGRPLLDPLYRDYPVTTDHLYGAFIENGQWSDWGLGGTCGAVCSCNARCEIYLDGPVNAITEVTVATLVIAPAAYHVANRNILVRTDGTCWPTCVSYGDDPPGFTVTYTRGTPIPGGVQQATNRYACELAKGFSGGECRLPNQVRTLTRQGVEIQLADVTTTKGIRTGIREVDAIITADNPNGRTQPAMVFTPDVPMPRQRT